MKYRIALDTFHFGIKCDFSDVDSILSKIKKNLFFTPEVSKSKNPYYYYGWQYGDIGFNVYFDLKSGLANCPISVELNGKFFRLQEFSEKFVNWILGEFTILPQRCDSCIDCIYVDSNELVNSEHFSDSFPLGFPVASINNDFRYKVGTLEGHFDFVDGKPIIDLLSSGRGELKLRVYDKDKDIRSKDGSSVTYYDVYGIASYRCFRIEFAVRSDSLKALFEKYSGQIVDCSSLSYLILSSMFKRYSFLNCNLNDVFNEDVSFYLSKKDSDLEFQISDCLNKMRKETNRFVILNRKAYKEKCRQLKQDDLFSRNLYLRQIDFYDCYDKLNQEGIY